MMRMRYMLSPGLQAAFAKVDMTMQGLVNHPYCPGAVRWGYGKAKDMLGGMVDAEA